MSESRTKAGVVVFLVWQHQFFMILRDDKPEILFPNTWGPVTGGREDEETLQEAAERELREEIGFVPEHLAMLGVSGKGNAFLFGRLTDEERTSITLGEGQKFDFFSYDQLGQISIGGAMDIYLKKYPDALKAMAETERPPFGRELGLATWDGESA